MASFGESLRLLRKHKKMTQAQLAHALNFTERGYRNYEIGKSTPSFNDLMAIADYFDVGLDVLVGRPLKKSTLTSLDEIISAVSEAEGQKASPAVRKRRPQSEIMDAKFEGMIKNLATAVESLAEKVERLERGKESAEPPNSE
ncbi:MAG: helix-turn-helix transcriptional regulator [Clostridiales bacterium]|nr:helix-turn-helix transcriptional regulator [Clostridiales bacterium]